MRCGEEVQSVDESHDVPAYCTTPDVWSGACDWIGPDLFLGDVEAVDGKAVGGGVDGCASVDEIVSVFVVSLLRSACVCGG